jgi:predicted ATPase
VQTLLERIAGEPHTRVRCFCSPHHQDSALYPSIAHLERAAGFRRDDNAEERLDKLELLLAQATDKPDETAPLIAELLSIPSGERFAPLEITPQMRKEKMLRALLAQLEGLAAHQAALMLFEDAHWSDPTSIELLDLIVDQAASLRLLLIVTFRPEFTAPWIGRAHVSLLSLNGLPPREQGAIMAGITGGKSLPQEIFQQIIDRTDGVPLFVEELTKAVIESGMLTDLGDRYVAAGPLPSLAIPATLHASLLARLDRMAPVREVAQIGAALGRHFSHELISAIAAMPQPQLDGALAQLVRAELVNRRGVPPDAEYTFKHALVQDAAYQSMLKSRRAHLHALIADALERSFPQLAQAEPETLACHLTAAALAQRAIPYWLAAGRSAIAKCISDSESSRDAASSDPITSPHPSNSFRGVAVGQ